MLVSAPGVQAEEAPVLAVEFDLIVTLPTLPDRVTYPKSDNGTDGCTAEGRITAVVGGGFRFREPSEEAGCARAWFDVAVPAGATTAEVHFTADRQITKSVENGIQPRMQQELLIGSDAARPIFDPYAGSQAPTDHVATHALGKAASLLVGWHFSDEAKTERAPIEMPSTGNQFHAIVSDATVHFPHIPARTSATAEAFALDQMSTLTRHRVRFDVSEGADAINVLFTLNGANVAAVFGPDGAVTERLAVGLSAGQLMLQDATPGSYEVVLESITPRPAIYLSALPAMAVAAPALAAAAATASHLTWARGAHPSQATLLRSSGVILGVLGAGVMAFAIYTMGGGAAQMGRAPTPLQGWAGFGVAILLTIGMAVVTAQGLIQRRHALERAHADILTEANRQLHRSNRDLGNFATVASHDLKAPLRRVVSLTQLLQRRLGPRTDADVEELLQMAVENGLHMQHLIDDMLAFSRLEQRTEHRPIPLKEVLDGVCLDAEVDLQAAGATLTLRVEGAVMGTKTLLRELFSNLLGNAIRYRRPEVPLEVLVSARVVGTDVVVSVRDNGRGIPERQQERIFEMFARAHQQVAGDPGTGIGLATCRRIVELHRGSIVVQSAPDEGSTFTVRLPAAP